MKIYFIIPLVLFTACASRPKPQVVQMPKGIPGTLLSTEEIESVRYSENIKAYPIGRYVDPNNRLVMHERHTVYRVETTGKWNLHPNAPASVPLGPPVQIIDSAKSNAPVNAEVIAEVNKQKATTQTVLDQQNKLEQTLSHLSGAFQITQQVGEQNQQMRQELTTTQKRLDTLEQELRKKEAESLFDSKQNAATNKW